MGPLPSLLLTRGPVSAVNTNHEVKPEVMMAGLGQPAQPKGGSRHPEAAAETPHVTYDDSVPSSLRYGPRELRHMQALGLIPKSNVKDSPKPVVSSSLRRSTEASSRTATMP